MERNRIQRFLVEQPQPELGAWFGRESDASEGPATSLVGIPPALWSGLSDQERSQLLSMLERARQRAEAQIRSECVERLLESITPR